MKEIPPNQLKILNDHLKERLTSDQGKNQPNYETESDTPSDKQVDSEVLTQIMQEKINELKRLVKPG